MTCAEARKLALECLFKLCSKHSLKPREEALRNIRELSESILENVKFSEWLSRR